MKVEEIKDLVNKAFSKSQDNKISMYLVLMDLMAYYDNKTSVEEKGRLRKYYNLD